MSFKKIALVAAVSLLGLAQAAQASVTTYNLAWSGASLGNTETISGTMTVDTAAFGSGDYSLVSAIDLTTSVAPSTHYTLGDFGSMYWWGDAGMNLGTQLVGQSSNGSTWGTSDTVSGDFNLFGGVLNGTDYFQLSDSITGNTVQLTSFAPASVPEPASLALLGLGFAGLVNSRRKAKQA